MIKWFQEPAFINFLQAVCYVLAGLAGFMAVIGAIPVLVNAQIGPIMAVIVGSFLVFGGIIGALSVKAGHWWAERIAIWIVAVGWVMLLVPTLFFAFKGSSSTVWLIVALEITAIIGNMTRYRRIDWAYLDPAK
jgi:hypothetical protein